MNGSANVRCDRNELALVSGGVHVGAARHPDKVAVIMAGDGLTYRSLATRMRQLSAAACAAGVQPGDRVAVIAPNCLEYVELVCGLSDVGAVVVTLSARYTSREIAEVCADCRPRLVIYHPDCESAITQVQFKGVEHVIRLGEEYEHWLADAPPLEDCPRVDPDSPFCLVYSSGTTGKPKGVLISHRSRVLTFHAMAMEYGCYGPDDLHLGLAPMAHGAGFAFIMAAVYFGGTVELMPRFDPEALVRWLAEKPFTGVFAVPAHFSAVFALPGSVLSRWRGQARTLRTIISNASALPQALKERIVDYWGETCCMKPTVRRRRGSLPTCDLPISCFASSASGDLSRSLTSSCWMRMVFPWRWARWANCIPAHRISSKGTSPTPSSRHRSLETGGSLQETSRARMLMGSITSSTGKRT